MSLEIKPSETTDIRMKLSTLWIVVALNYVYGDVFTLLAKGTAISFTQGSQLGSAVLVETPIVIVFLSRRLKNHKVNRWSNILVGAINALATVASLLAGKSLERKMPIMSSLRSQKLQVSSDYLVRLDMAFSDTRNKET